MSPPRHLPSIQGSVVADRIYRATILFFALCVPVLLLLIFVEVGRVGLAGAAPVRVRLPHVERLGPGERRVRRGARRSSARSLTSVIALVIATPLALGVAIFLSEFSPRWLRQPVSFLVDLLAAVPSVVYGLWGVFVLVPLLRERHRCRFLRDTLHLGATPFFSGPAYGPSMLAAGLILAIMVLPYISAVSREVLLAVPRSQREAALALGATRWETITGRGAAVRAHRASSAASSSAWAARSARRWP